MTSTMDPQTHLVETPSADIAKGRSFAISLSSEVNMTTVIGSAITSLKDLALLDDGRIPRRLEPVDSVEETYEKGQGVLFDSYIRRGTLKCTSIGRCTCAVEFLGYVDLLDLHDIENVVLTEGMLKMRVSLQVI